jgi:subtilisin family serine protease
MKKLSLILAALFMAASAQAAQKIITFESAYRDGRVKRGVERLGGKVVRQYETFDAMVVDFPEGFDNARLRSVAGVSSVEDDKVIKWIESAPTLEEAYGLASGKKEWAAPAVPAAQADETEIPWGVKRVNAAAAWGKVTGAGVKVAVIDTGIDYTHPDLKDNYAGGYNAIVTTMTPMDDQGHGTHVAGTIGAVRNGAGVVGVAPGVRLYGVKVLDSRGSGSYSNVMAGIDWATANGMQVINMSLGGGGYMEAMHKAVKAAKAAGIAVVCAAGNDSSAVNYPARYPESIAISASDSADKLASFSSRGPELAFIAPGVNVYSTRMGGGYRNMSGTSMACPHAAGLAALAVSAGAKGSDAVLAAMKAAATQLPLVNAGHQGAGLVDAALLAK